MNDTTETKPLTKHISAAVNAIQKQIESYQKVEAKLLAKARIAEGQAEDLREAVKGLQEQISKLKGE